MTREREHYRREMEKHAYWILYPRRSLDKHGSKKAIGLATGLAIGTLVLVVFDPLGPHSWTDAWKSPALAIGLLLLFWLVMLAYFAVRWIALGFINDD